MIALSIIALLVYGILLRYGFIKDNYYIDGIDGSVSEKK